MEAICLNRLDQMMRAGTYPRPIHLPHARLGCEGTGTIDAVGEGVEQFRIGDAVIVTALPASDLNGTYADYTRCPQVLSSSGRTASMPFTPPHYGSRGPQHTVL